MVEKWKFPTGAVVTASPTVVPVEILDGSTRRMVFTVSWDGFLYALDFETGEEAWRFAWERAWTWDFPPDLRLQSRR